MLTIDGTRETKETRIQARIDWMSPETDSCEVSKISTGVGFMDHMLTLMAYHGGFTLNVTAEGDLDVDTHHLVEDLGIVLGGLFNKLAKALLAVGAINRYGCCILPMDEALVRVVMDVSGRGGAWFDHQFTVERLGRLETETIREFFIAFAGAAGCTLHLDVLKGINNHHVAEALFKGLGRAIGVAYGMDSNATGERRLGSTKGILELGGNA